MASRMPHIVREDTSRGPSRRLLHVKQRCSGTCGFASEPAAGVAIGRATTATRRRRHRGERTGDHTAGATGPHEAVLWCEDLVSDERHPSRSEPDRAVHAKARRPSQRRPWSNRPGEVPANRVGENCKLFRRERAGRRRMRQTRLEITKLASCAHRIGFRITPPLTTSPPRRRAPRSWRRVTSGVETPVAGTRTLARSSWICREYGGGRTHAKGIWFLHVGVGGPQATSRLRSPVTAICPLPGARVAPNIHRRSARVSENPRAG